MTTEPHSTMVSVTDFESVDEGSNPSGVANLEYQSEIDMYRAHLHKIIRLSTDGFALLNPFGQVLAVGSLADLEPLIPTGPDHYETCVDNWTSREKVDMRAGRQLLDKLGITTQHPHPQITRRI